MPISKPLTQFEELVGALGEAPEEFDFSDEENDQGEETADGGVIVDLSDTPEDATQVFDPENEDEFGENLCAYLSDTEMNTLASDLVMEFDADLMSRDVWEKRYTNGIRLLGINPDERTEPWQGACGVYHPVLMEAAIGFQSNAIQEICPASGPSAFKIIGAETIEKQKRGRRVQVEMNYQIMTRMPEWRPEMDRLLWAQCLQGSAFKKAYFDPILKRPSSRFISATDFVVQYGASDLQSCPRYTHQEKVFKHSIEKLQDIGFYRDIDLGDPHLDQDDVEEAQDKLTGVAPSYIEDDRYLILEMHVERRIEGLYEETRPYVVTVERHTNTILAIRRNWREGDENRIKRVHFIHYPYIPGDGFYAMGLIHIIGGPAEAATALLRQLVDCGTINNVPSGFKSRTTRILGDETPLSPGEFRDVDVSSGKIEDGILFLPSKQPSPVSLELLGGMVEEARRTASMAEMKLTDSSASAPVGTTLALLERSLTVVSAVHSRIHYALTQELTQLQEIIAKDMPPEYDYDKELMFDRQRDFGGDIAVIPVSDPNSATQSQRIIQFQTIVQMAAAEPESVFDKPYLYQSAIRAMNMGDAEKLVPLPEEMLPTDPISENSNILMGKPVKAHLEEDHEAHLKVHMAALKDPNIMAMVGQLPNAAIIQGAAYAHIMEHMGYKYRSDVEKRMGIPLPPPNENLPTDLAANLAQLAGDAAERVLQDSIVEKAAADAQAAAQDPAMQIELGKLEIAKDSNRIKEKLGEQTNQVKILEIKKDLKIHGENLDSKELIEGAKLGVQEKKDRSEAAKEKANGPPKIAKKPPQPKKAKPGSK